MTDAAVLGHAPRLEHCAGGDVHPLPKPAAAPPAIQESRGSAPMLTAENSLVPRELSTPFSLTRECWYLDKFGYD